jgi:hypothetical protein
MRRGQDSRMSTEPRRFPLCSLMEVVSFQSADLLAWSGTLTFVFHGTLCIREVSTVAARQDNFAVHAGASLVNIIIYVNKVSIYRGLKVSETYRCQLWGTRYCWRPKFRQLPEPRL